MKRFRSHIAILVSFILGFEPLLEAAQVNYSHQKDVKEFLAETGLGVKGTTYKQVYDKYRLWLPPSVRAEMSNWIKLYGDQTVADVQMTPFVDKDGIEQVRLTLSKDNQTLVMTTTGDEKNPGLKVGNEKITGMDYYQPHRLINRIFQADVALQKSVGFSPEKYVITGQQFLAMPMTKKVEYFKKLRETAESAERLNFALAQNQTTSKLDSFKNFWQGVIGSAEAVAAGDYPARGEQCIVAGHVTTYSVNSDKRLSCGSSDPRVTQGCESGKFKCEEIIFPGAGCAAGPAPAVTVNCSKQSPVENIQKNLQATIKDKASADKAMSQASAINDSVNEAILAGCKGQNTGHKLSDQDPACTELEKRFLALQEFQQKNGSLAGGRGDAGESCTNRGGVVVNSIKDGAIESSTCQCKGKVLKDNEQCGAGPSSSGRDCNVVKAEPCDCPGDQLIDQKLDGTVVGCKGDAKKEEKKAAAAPSFWDKYKSWIIGGGILLATGGLLWWMISKNRRKKKRKVRVASPPVAPPGVIDGGGGGPVDPPPPPVIDNPAEGGSGSSKSTSGGVR